MQRDIDFTMGIGDFRAKENEIRINLEAPIILSGLQIPRLARAELPAISNVSAALGFVPAVRMPVYGASKVRIHAWSMAVRRQLSPVGLKVFEVVPPAVDTKLNPIGRAARGCFSAGFEPREFVAAIMKGSAKDIRNSAKG